MKKRFTEAQIIAPTNDHSKEESNTISLPAVALAVTGYDR